MNIDRIIQNPFKRIYQGAQCKRPYSHPLANFPLLLDIEPTNACNLDCLMCPRQIMARKIGFMEPGVFERIIDEAAIYQPGIRFIRYGEPMLHKKIFSFVKSAKKHNLICHITTNGLLLDVRMTDKIFSSGLDSIIFSFQGSNKKEYERIRNNTGYSALRSNICNLRKKRDKNRLNRPFIQINTTFLDESKKAKKEFIKEWEGIADHIDTWHTTLLRLKNIKRVEPLLARQRVKEIAGRGRCAEVMTKLSVNWNGDVTACCGDYNGELIVGSILKNSLKEIWKCERLQQIRDKLSKGKFKDIPFCALCTTKFIQE